MTLFNKYQENRNHSDLRYNRIVIYDVTLQNLFPEIQKFITFAQNYIPCHSGNSRSSLCNSRLTVIQVSRSIPNNLLVCSFYVIFNTVQQTELIDLKAVCVLGIEYIVDCLVCTVYGTTVSDISPCELVLFIYLSCSNNQ